MKKSTDKQVLEIIKKHARIEKGDLYNFKQLIKIFDVFIDEEKHKEDFEILENWLNGKN